MNDKPKRSNNRDRTPTKLPPEKAAPAAKGKAPAPDRATTTRSTSARASSSRSTSARAPQAPALSSLAIQRAITQPASATAQEILGLQPIIGNRAVSRLLSSAAAPGEPPQPPSKPRVQAKLTVGPAGDPYEQEADRVAGEVVRMPEPASRPPLEQDEATAQRRAAPRDMRGSFEAGSEVESRLAANTGGGNPLPGETRSFMEARFGANFDSVRVHTGGESAQLNRQLSAQAFTHGADIYMGAGKYAPGTAAGKQLLAHELTHVVQQGGARSRRTQAKLTVGAAGDRYEQEADRVAQQVMRMADPGRAGVGDQDEKLQAGPPGVQLKAIARDNVIQRAVGFEFETTWGSMVRSEPKAKPTGLSGLFAKDTEPKLSIEELSTGRAGLQSLGKGDPIVKGTGFEMQADLAGTASDIEFVTDPPGFNIPSQMDDLQTTMQEMVLLVDKLEAAKKKYGGDMFSAKYVGGPSEVLLEPPSNATTAKAQVTGGLLLERLPALMKDLGYDQSGGGTRSEGSESLMGMGGEVKEAQAVHDAAAKARAACEALRQQDPKRGGGKLEGLLALIISYLLMGDRAEKEFAYAKHIAVLMARTDLGTLFKTLPDDDRLPFENQPGVWAPFVLAAAGLAGTESATVFGKGYAGNEFNPTRGEWLGKLCQGVDLMTDKAAKAAGEIDEKNEQGQDNSVFEGMGRLGEKTEPVGPQGAQGAIFELRRIKEDLYYKNWPAFTETIAAYFVQLNDPTVGTPRYKGPAKWRPESQLGARARTKKPKRQKAPKKSKDITISGPTGGRLVGTPSPTPSPSPGPPAPVSTALTTATGGGKAKGPSLFKRLFSKLFGKRNKTSDLVVSGPSGGRFQSDKPTPTTAKAPPVPIQAEFFKQPKWVDHFFKWAAHNEEGDRINRTLTEVYVKSLALTTGALTYEVARAFFDGVLKPAAGNPIVREMIYTTREGKETDYTLDELEGYLASSEVFASNRLGGKIISEIPQNLSYHVLAFYSAYTTWLQSAEGKLDLQTYWGTVNAPPPVPSRENRPPLSVPVGGNVVSQDSTSNVKQLAKTLEGKIRFGPRPS